MFDSIATLIGQRMRLAASLSQPSESQVGGGMGDLFQRLVTHPALAEARVELTLRGVSDVTGVFPLTAEGLTEALRALEAHAEASQIVAPEPGVVT
jgi:hypothetical protein